MCLYWTFPHEAINGVLKGFAARNSNHRNVGTSLMKRHFLFRFLYVTLGDDVIPPSSKVLRCGVKMKRNPYCGRINELFASGLRITHKVGYMSKWQCLWPDMVITFCDMSVWMSIDVLAFRDMVWIYARQLRFARNVESTGYPMYEFTDRREILRVSDVLYVSTYSWLNNRSLVLKTYDHK